MLVSTPLIFLPDFSTIQLYIDYLKYKTINITSITILVWRELHTMFNHIPFWSKILNFGNKLSIGLHQFLHNLPKTNYYLQQLLLFDMRIIWSALDYFYNALLDCHGCCYFLYVSVWARSTALRLGIVDASAEQISSSVSVKLA